MTRFARIPDEYMQTISDIYKDGTARLLVSEKRKNPIQREVRQRNAVYRMLFTECLEKVFKLIGWEEREIRIDREYLRCLRFADDIVPFCNDGGEIQNRVEDLTLKSLKTGLKINSQTNKIELNSLPKKQEYKINERPF